MARGHDHELRRKENVFVFSLAAAVAQLTQFIAMVSAPAGIADTGAHLHHLTTGTIDREEKACHPHCAYSGHLLFLGDAAPPATGPHPAAEQARAAQAHRHAA